jgi:hypothetical protein
MSETLSETMARLNKYHANKWPAFGRVALDEWPRISKAVAAILVELANCGHHGAQGVIGARHDKFLARIDKDEL